MTRMVGSLVKTKPSPTQRGLLTFAAVLCALSCQSPSPTSAQDVVAFDNFEGLTLVPFDLADQYFRPGNGPWADGTDWSKDFPTGWALDNSANTYDNTNMPGEFDGWSLMDVTSWIAHAGVQSAGDSRGLGRDRSYFGSEVIDGVPYRNTCLVADADEADDGGNAAGGLGGGYNSYITRAYNVSTADLNSLSLSFDFDFITDGSQQGVVDVSFDDGTTWQNLLTMTDDALTGRDDVPYGTYSEAADSGVFTAASGDFTPASGATEMLVRFGCITAGNNWWFTVDNVGLADVNGVIAFEDFEDTAEDLVPFNYAVNGAPTSPPLPFQPSDGTDWTADLSSIGWEIINDAPGQSMGFDSIEGAYDGGAVLDAFSWSYQTSSSTPTAQDESDINSGWGQRRSMFRDAFWGTNNSVLVFDPDQSFDNRENEGDPIVFNSYAQKVYDMSDFDNDSVKITLEWEIRIESPQLNVMEVSFDGRKTWTRIFEMDPTNLTDPAVQAEFLPYLDFDAGDAGVINQSDIIRTFSTGAQEITVSDFFPNGNVPDSNKMAFRIGCLNAGNNWWFAVDDVLVQANAQAFVVGDANGDGIANFGDITAGVTAILTGTISLEMDINEDGVVNFGDLTGFTNAILSN